MLLVSLFPFLPALLWILALLQFDDPLAPEARALVALTTAPEANNAYLYLLGIDAPLDQDPARLGQTILERVRQQEQLVAEGHTENPPPPSTNWRTLWTRFALNWPSPIPS